MGSNDEVMAAVRQLNRRLVNMENSVRMLEQRVDAVDGMNKAIEAKIARNTKDIIGSLVEIRELNRGSKIASELREKVVGFEALIRDLSVRLEALAPKEEVESLRRHLELIQPLQGSGGK